MSATKLLKTSSLIRALRQHLNLSQERFAAKLGVSFKTVNRWENGHTQPSPMALKLIEELAQEVGKLDIASLDQTFLKHESENQLSNSRNEDSLIAPMEKRRRVNRQGSKSYDA